MLSQSPEEIINCFLSPAPVLIFSSPPFRISVVAKLPPHYSFIAQENIFPKTLFKIKEEQTNKIH